MKSEDVTPLAPGGTVEVEGKCFNAWEVNYVDFAYVARLCNIARQDAAQITFAYRFSKDVYKTARGEDEHLTGHAVRFVGAALDGKLAEEFGKQDPRYAHCKSCGEKYTAPKLASAWPGTKLVEEGGKKKLVGRWGIIE